MRCRWPPLQGKRWQLSFLELFLEVFSGSGSAPGLVFRGYANENSPVMVLINSSTTGPFKAVQELQKQETLIHDIINSSFFVFLISSSELFCFHPAPAVVFQHHPALCVMMCSSLFLRLVKIPLVLLQWMSRSQTCNASMFLHQLSFDWMGIVVWSIVEPKRIPRSKHFYSGGRGTVTQSHSICLLVDVRRTHTFRCHMARFPSSSSLRNIFVDLLDLEIGEPIQTV